MSQPPDDSTRTSAPDWYLDPADPNKLRYWDGHRWTDHTAVMPAPAAQNYHPAVAVPTSPSSSGVVYWTGPTGPPTPSQAVEEERAAQKWLLIAGVIAAVGATFQIYGFIRFFRLFFDVFTSEAETIEASEFDPDLVTFQLALSAASLLTWPYFGVRIWWTLRVCRAGESFGARLPFNAPWHAVGWILPVVNFWFPYIGIKASVRPGTVKWLGWWWASTLTNVFFALVLGVIIGWQSPLLGTLVGGVVNSMHIWIEYRVSGSILRSHEAELRPS
jgi:hypothetical protein